MPSIASNDSQLETLAANAAAWNNLPPGYAIPVQAPSQAEAQEYCRRLARTHYENFSVATWFLPQRLRQHFFNVYAYCRISDDLGDEVGNPSASLQLLDQWEAELGACYSGSPRHPVFVALAETVRKCLDADELEFVILAHGADEECAFRAEIVERNVVPRRRHGWEDTNLSAPTGQQHVVQRGRARQRRGHFSRGLRAASPTGGRGPGHDVPGARSCPAAGIARDRPPGAASAIRRRVHRADR